MDQAELREIADQFLKDANRNPRYPHYTDAIFEAKLRRQNELALLRLWHSRGLNFLASDQISVGVVARIIARAELSWAQGQVLSLWLAGLNTVEIGAIRGHTKQRSSRIFVLAGIKLRAAYESEPLVGAVDVYRELTRFRTMDSFFQ